MPRMTQEKQKGRDSLTPMMRQYKKIKAENQGKILLFRLGDFYEMFFEDAEIASKVLGLTLTSRSKGKDATPLAGIPYHAAESYIARFIRAGYKVAVCDQMEDPALAKGIVRREVTRVITAGTLTEDALLNSKANNFLAACALDGARAGLAFLDLSTGEFCLEELDAGELDDELSRIAPSECLFPEEDLGEEPAPYRKSRKAAEGRLNVTTVPPFSFDEGSARSQLMKLLGVKSLEGFGCGELGLAISAAGAIISYLKETQKTALGHIKSVKKIDRDEFVAIDSHTISNLELLPAKGGSEGASLLEALDYTGTAMGARKLRSWLLMPLRKPEAIVKRLAGVKEFFADTALRMAAADSLKAIHDLERLTAKISTLRANARDLVALKNSLAEIPGLAERLKDAKSAAVREVREALSPQDELVGLIGRTLVDEPPATLDEGGLIKDGVSRELDELRSISRGGKSWIASFQKDEVARTGIGSLKVGYNRVFGYYIEVTKANLAHVPASYIRKQTIVNGERFITPELKEWEEKVLGAEEKIVRLERELFEGIRKEAAARAAQIQLVADAVAVADAMSSLAEAAVRNKYVAPEVDDSLVIEIADGRHPVLERVMGPNEFIPNDTFLDGEKEQILIITGPNMAGKSTYIRQVALIVIMAQMGSFVPAAKARVGVVDKIFTRVGASDNISMGRSTFMVEMLETANILNNATARSLIVLDEVGRGTSTFDGVSIAWAITEFLHNNPRAAARTVFATHYHELTALASELRRVRNYNVAVREWNEEIIFLRKIVEGGADKSYGLHVARIAGVPREVIERAKEILERLESSATDIENRAVFASGKRTRRSEKQLALFERRNDAAEDVAASLRGLDVDELKPVEALLKLKELKEKLK